MNKTELLRKNTFLKIISSIFVGVFLTLATLYVFAYAYGYRIKLDRNKPYEETGVLSIESTPSQANIYIDSEEIGKTPKTVGSLSEGEYDVKVEKEGYKTWQKKLTIKGQLSTPYTAFLFLTEPKYETEVNREIVSKDSYTYTKTHVFIPTITTETNSTTNVTVNYYTIEAYKINKDFWDFSANPIVVFKTVYTNGDSYKIQPSNNGESLFITKYVGSKSTPTESYIAKTNGIIAPDKFDKNPLESFYNGYTIKWSNSNNYLTLESDSEILSYDIRTKAVIVLLKKNQSGKNVLWNTDSAGNFYYMEEASVVEPSNELVNGKNYMRIVQKELDGTNTNIIIDNIFYTTDNKGISQVTALDKIPFANSPFSTRFCGKINNFEFQTAGNGAVITTEFAIYWYDLETEKYTLIDQGDIEQIEYSSDEYKYLFINKTSDTLNSYTIKVETSDHVNSVGNKIILSEISKLKTSFQWLENSYYIRYTLNNTVNVVDFDGENKFEVITHDTTDAFIFDNQNAYVYTVNTKTNELSTEDATKSLNNTHLTVKKWQVH